MKGFNHNVFVNCPFDDDYRSLHIALLFTVKYLGYNPRLSLERADSAESRIDKIVGLINESKYGIHDLSRIISTGENEHFRMNMPFELGIDYGCQKLKGEQWSLKQILILEQEQYRYQKALSDLSGSDIKKHENESDKLIKAVRDWFVTVDPKAERVVSGNNIWKRLNEFHAYLYDELVEKDGHKSIDDVQITEILQLMTEWLKNET